MDQKPNAAIDVAMPLIKRFEGLRLVPYADACGYPTVGYGHLLSRDPAGIAQFGPIDIETAERLLHQDILRARNSVMALCPVALSDNQIAALISFVFNLGGGNLEVSTLRRKINRGDIGDASVEFPKWSYAGKHFNHGLFVRRTVEASLFDSIV